MATCYHPLGAIEIRSATTERDLQAIATLAPLVWRASFRDLISDAQIEYMLRARYAPAVLAEALHSRTPAYLILSVDGEPLAFAAHRGASHPGEHQLQQLYVHPAWQGRGLGSRLIVHVEELARTQGCSALVLTVNRGNRTAQATYARHGFRIREAVVVDIGGGFVMDDFVMVKALDAGSGGLR